MAPIIINAHSCKYCERIVVDRGRRRSDQVQRDQTSDSHHVAEMETKAIFDITLTYLLEASSNSCRLCSWILDEECVALEDLSPRLSGIRDDSLRKSFEQASMWLPSSVLSCPPQTVRGLATQRPKGFENVCLFLGAKDETDVREVDFFGFWDKAKKEITCRTRLGLRVQASEGTAHENMVLV